MRKRISRKDPDYRPSDPNQLANLLVRLSTENGDVEKPLATPSSVSKSISRVMAQMGSRGGKIGGKRRLVTLSAEKRSQIASDAAKARWAKKIPVPIESK
jgi:hypothetical protein